MYIHETKEGFWLLSNHAYTSYMYHIAIHVNKGLVMIGSVLVKW